MTDKQPEALRLADLLEDECSVDGYAMDEAAAELRRLHEENERLKAEPVQEPLAVYMTLRDYFAAQAMQSVMANFARAEYDDVARHSYQLADEMMKARGEKSG